MGRSLQSLLVAVIHLLSTSLAFTVPPTFKNSKSGGVVEWQKNYECSQTSRIKLFTSKRDDDDVPMRFLGKGDRAVIRPGVVLVAPVHEYNHFLMRSAVFIHAIGVNEYDEHVTRGVIIDHPTAFTMGEMGGGSIYGNLAHSILFQGGDNGNDSAMLLHSYGGGDFDEDRVDCGSMIGASGIYEGGVDDAMDLVDAGVADPERFKFFFNYVEFSDQELEGMLSATDSDGDAWSSMEVPTRIILDSDFSRGDGWSYLRNQMKVMQK